MRLIELDVSVDDRLIRVRDAGDQDGAAVVFFHGTPSSRLDLHLAEPLAQQQGIRLVSFDRPGYGGSTPAPFSFTSVARDIGHVADTVGLEQFAVFGQSAGSRYALAAAATLGQRVTNVGVAAGSLKPGPPHEMDHDEQAAWALLAHNPAGAATLIAGWLESLVQVVRDGGDDDAIVAFFELALPAPDRELLRDPQTRAGAAANVRESLRQGAQGAGWDGVNHLRPWEFDLDDVRCPVLIWFGDQDEPLEDAVWLSDRVAHPRLLIWPGEGHLAYKPHVSDIFDALVVNAV